MILYTSHCRSVLHGGYHDGPRFELSVFSFHFPLFRRLFQGLFTSSSDDCCFSLRRWIFACRMERSRIVHYLPSVETIPPRVLRDDSHCLQFRRFLETLSPSGSA
uniref:Uncharacterized protein n=1 Tax=Physcomitrium patens TaxID=3218 RepID=A0A2K1J3D0_PHYPA|nr:hypothetical protein PHYPA_021882 [Physcomitrium patens]